MIENWFPSKQSFERTFTGLCLPGFDLFEFKFEYDKEHNDAVGEVILKIKVGELL